MVGGAMEELLFWERILCKKTEGDMGGGGLMHTLWSGEVILTWSFTANSV